MNFRLLLERKPRPAMGNPSWDSGTGNDSYRQHAAWTRSRRPDQPEHGIAVFRDGRSHSLDGLSPANPGGWLGLD